MDYSTLLIPFMIRYKRNKQSAVKKEVPADFVSHIKSTGTQMYLLFCLDNLLKEALTPLSDYIRAAPKGDNIHLLFFSHISIPLSSFSFTLS